MENQPPAPPVEAPPNPHYAMVVGALSNHPKAMERRQLGLAAQAEDYGLRSCHIVFGGRDRRPPSEADLRRHATYAAAKGQMLIRNDETYLEPHRANDFVIQRNADRLFWEMSVMRSTCPQLMYGYYNQPSTDETFNARAFPDRIKKLDDNFTYFQKQKHEDKYNGLTIIDAQPLLMPSMYQPSAGKQAIHHEQWHNWLDVVLEYCRALNKLCVPFISMNYQGESNFGVLPAEAFAAQVESCLTKADGCVFWNQSKAGWGRKMEACYEAGMEVLDRYGLASWEPPNRSGFEL